VSDDIVIAKGATIERCIARARSELALSSDFAADVTRQDAAVLNIQRACEGAIDIAFRLVRQQGLGAPVSSRDAFDMLASAGVITADLQARLKRMVGFRNIAVHRYSELDVIAVEAVIRDRLDDLAEFVGVALRI
jgi:uncharacterized protein YutE (UPF0331/DUF86 family)